MTGILTPERLATAMTYDRYRERIRELLAAGRTTGTDHSDQMVEFTRLNDHRMGRIERTVTLSEKTRSVLAKLDRKLKWVLLAEAWCGDVAQNLPILAMMADAAPGITLRILLRDENPDIMDAYLTNGGRAIPKLVCLDGTTLTELFTWGPRPEPAQAMVREHKKDPQEPYSEFVKKVQLWYAKDKGKSIQREFRDLLTALI